MFNNDMVYRVEVNGFIYTFKTYEEYKNFMEEIRS